ncbi:MAG: esterase-like activity of phytase family protein [Rhodospirillales bacterium]|nr:esterase-like activity of phytase family protein [Rhodospirillales bacterium]
MLRLLLLFAAIIGMVGDADAAHPSVPALFSDGAAIKVTTVGVPLDVDDPQRTAVGELRYRGGLELRSEDARFGGLSGLTIDADGGSLTAISDRGYWLLLRLVHVNGDLAGIAEAVIGELPFVRATPDSADAEAMAPMFDGSVIVAFEREHRLMRYFMDGQPPLPVAPPPGLSDMPSNGGIESLARLPDGRLLMLAEQDTTDDGVLGWVRNVSGSWFQFEYLIDGGFRPTDAATLPGGDVLVVERRFPPLDVRLRRIAADTLEPGAAVSAEAVAHLGGGVTVDNMEGIAVCRDSDGRTLVYIVSDDNYSVFQRTLLLMFELVD